MIRVDRARVPEPQALHAKSVEGHLREVSAFFEQRALETRRQERFRFPLMTKPVFEDVMGALRKVFSGKCAYCETPLSRDNESLDRFRPKKGAIGLTQDYAPDHYWWLAYEWRNLYAACATCNKNKGSKFPVKGQRVRLKASWRDLDREQRLLIDPCGDDPTLDLAFQEDGFVAPHSERGDVTMGVLELNRRDLVRARAELGRRVALAIVGLRHLTAGPEGIDVSGPEDLVLSVMKTGPAVSPYQAKTLDWLSEAARPSAPHAAVARTLIRSWLSSLAPATPTTRALRKVRKARHVRLKTQYITAIEIRGFRGVSQLDLAVPTQTSEDAPAPHLMLLGENGAGKSSILQAIALTVGGGKGSGIRPAEVLRQGAKAGRVRIHISGNAVPLELKLGRGTTSFTVAGEPFHGVLLAYGATRLLPRGSNGKAGTGKRRVTNLFDPFRPLLDANRWMSRLPRPTFDYVARALKDVLDLPRAARLRVVTTRSGPQVRVRLYGCDLGLEQLSDGYQSVLGLTCDVMSGLMSTQLGALEAAEGIVLIDELGAHLHPRWRMRVVSSLRKAFPRVQFVMSTHDPLCLRGLQNGEVVVLRRTATGKVFSVPDLPPVKGMPVDELLKSEYFGLSSTMDPLVESRFHELYDLLALRAPNDAQQKRIGELREHLKDADPPGTSRRERRLLAIIDAELAKLDDTPDPQERLAIVQEAQRQVAADLSTLLTLLPPELV